MLEYRGNGMRRQAQLLALEASYVADPAPSQERLAPAASRFTHQQAVEILTPHITGVQADLLTCTRREWADNSSSDLKVVAPREWNPVGATSTEFHSSRACDVKEARHGGMTVIGQPRKSSSLGDQSKKRKCLDGDVKGQEEGENKKHCADREADAAELNTVEYFSGDSDLTAEHMAEGSSRTSSLEDGCTLTLESAATPTESLSKGSITPEKQQSADLSFSFSKQVNVDRQSRQQGSSTSAEERQFRFQSLAAAVGQTDQDHDHDQLISRGSGGRVVSEIAAPATATNPDCIQGNNQADAEDEDDWLQLGLGSNTYSERPRLTASHCRLRSSSDDGTSSATQPVHLATLQLLPQKPEYETSRPCEAPLPTRRNDKSFSRADYERGRLIPFMAAAAAAAATVRSDPSEASAKRNADGSTYFGSFREIQEQVDSLIPQRSISYTSLLAGRDLLPIQNTRFPVLSGDQCSFSNKNETSCHADPRNFDEEEKKIGKLSGYAHSSYHQTANTQTSTEDRSNKVANCQDPMFSKQARERNVEGYAWQPPSSINTLPPWSSFQDQLPNRLPRNNLDSVYCSVEPGMAVQHNTLTFPRGQTSEEWQGIVKRFSTNLHFQSPDTDVSLLDGGRFSGSLMPAHDITVVQQAIERYQSSRSPNWDNRNLPSSAPSWITGSLLRSNSAEISSKRMLAVGQAERTPTVAERSQCEATRSFISPNQLAIATNLGSLVQQPLPESFSMPEKMKLRKPSREPQGFWFTLQAAEPQRYDRALPQIPKSYIRIKDARMPVSVVKKYLVAKLGLSSESEVEITCRGKDVVPNASLQHVRDEIWFTTDFDKGETLSFRSGNISSSCEEYVMILTYQSSHHIY